VTVDDLRHGVTLVIRGEDLLGEALYRTGLLERSRPTRVERLGSLFGGSGLLNGVIGQGEG
jgi:hypothetical protein